MSRICQATLALGGSDLTHCTTLADRSQLGVCVDARWRAAQRLRWGMLLTSGRRLRKDLLLHQVLLLMEKHVIWRMGMLPKQWRHRLVVLRVVFEGYALRA